MPGQKQTVFALVSAAILMDMLAYTLVIPVLPSYALALGADTVTLGIIFGAFSVALLLFSVPFGILSDRYGRRPFLLLGMLSLAATNVVFALSSDINVLIAARFLQGLSGAATWSAGLALLADTFGPEERGQRLGLAMSAMAVGSLLGPAIGGVLYDNLGYAPTFILPAVLAGVVGLAFLAVGEPDRRAASLPLRRGLEPFIKAPGTSIALSLIVIVGAMAYGLIEPYLPVYLYGTFSATATMVGLAFGAMALLSIASQPIVGRLYDRHGGRWLIAGGLLGSAAILAGCMLMPSFTLAAAVFSLLGITMCFALTPMLPLLSDLYGAGNSLGMVYGIYNSLFSLGLAIGPLAGGLLVASFTLPYTLFLQATLLAAAGIGAVLVIRKPSLASSK